MSIIQIPVELALALPHSLPGTAAGRYEAKRFRRDRPCYSQEAEPLEPPLVPINWERIHAILRVSLRKRADKTIVSQIEMHLFASRRSERHAQARRITAGSIQAKHPPIQPGLPSWQTRLPKRANPSSRVLGSPANILSLERRQPEIRTYISAARPNTACDLLRLSGQHGAATGASR